MSVEESFVALLLADTGVTDLVGTRVALSAVPEGELPLIVFTSDHNPTPTLLDANAADEVTLSVQCWGVNAVEALLVADAVRAAIAAASASACAAVTAQSSIYEEELGIDGIALTVSYWA